MSGMPLTQPINVIKKGQMIEVPHLGGTNVIEVRHIEQTADGVTITSETGGKWPLAHNDKIRVVFG